MNIYARFATGLALLGLLSGLVGCATQTRAPVFQATNFDPKLIDSIALLPVADLRHDKSIKTNANAILQKYVPGTLHMRGYRVDLAATGPDFSQLSEEDLIRPPLDWVKGLPPVGKRWIMIVAVHEITRKVTFGSTSNVEVAAYLYDKETGMMVWRDKGIGQEGQGGLAGLMMAGTIIRTALLKAEGEMFNSFPLRPKSP